jgi:hypothetical protein
VKLALLLKLVGGTPLASWCDVGYNTPSPSLLRAAEEVVGPVSGSMHAGGGSRRATTVTDRLTRPWWRSDAPLGYLGWVVAVALGVGMAWMSKGGDRALRMSNRAMRR